MKLNQDLINSFVEFVFDCKHQKSASVGTKLDNIRAFAYGLSVATKDQYLDEFYWLSGEHGKCIDQSITQFLKDKISYQELKDDINFIYHEYDSIKA